MPGTIANPRDVRALCLNKQQIEAQLAKDLYGVFNSGESLRKLQDFAGVILENMIANERAVKALRSALGRESSLRLWQKMGRDVHCIEIYARKRPEFQRDLDATDCADIIRLAGEWVEQGGLGKMGEDRKQEYRPGTGVGPKSTKYENVWGGQKRIRGKGREVESYLKAFQRDPAEFSGMKLKRPQGLSNVLKIDRLLGLVKACDISGTTADTVFALDTWGGGVFADTYYMLPLATIVHNMHHSILEVALALDLNNRLGDVGYRVGFYTTLLPSRQQVPAELSRIPGLLAAAEEKMKGLHFLCYYDNAQLQGAFTYKGQEQELKSSKLSRAPKLLFQAIGLSSHPTQEQVVLLRKYLGGPDL